MRNRGPAQIPKRIDSIKFSLMNPNEIRKMSSVEVKTADTYKDDGHAYKQGLMDPKMESSILELDVTLREQV